VVGGYDFAENDGNPYDDGPIGFHGTHIAGIIGGSSDDYSGIAPEVDLVALRVFNDNGAGDLARVEQALRWVHENRNAFRNPITTVNLSLGTNWNSHNVPNASILEDEFAQLEADGIFISVAAGNLFQQYQTTGVSYPAASPYVVPVASHGDSGLLSNFSQRNDRVLVAPGENILSTVPDHMFAGQNSDGYLRTTGTSQSAPYLAGASVLLREAFLFAGETNIDQDMLYGHFRQTADLVYDQATGGNYHRVNLARAIEAAIVDDHGNSQATATNAGWIQGGEVFRGVIGSTTDSDHFVFRAKYSGTISMNASTTGDLVPNIGIAGSNAHAAGNQISFSVVAGQEYRFQVGSAFGTGQYQIHVSLGQTPQQPLAPVNLVNGVLSVFGTAGNDNLQFRHGSSLNITLNGQQYQFDPRQVTEIVIVGNSGHDSITANFEWAVGRAVLQPTRLDVSTGTFDFAARGFESINVVAPGAERLIVFDSAGHDSFEAGNGIVQVVGNGFQNSARGFNDVVLVATSGHDQVKLVGSQGNDRLLVNDGRQVLRTEAGRTAAVGFDAMVVYAVGGSDTATIVGTAGNDRLELSGQHLHFASPGFKIWADGFERVSAVSGGGFDTAQLRGSESADNLIYREGTTRYSGSFFSHVIDGFRQVAVFGLGGADTARLNDSTSADTFRAAGFQSSLISQQAALYTDGFERLFVQADSGISSGGFDQAFLVGTAVNDFVEHDGFKTRLANANGVEIVIGNFEQVHVDTLSGLDHANIRGTEGRERFYAAMSGLEVRSNARLLQIVNSEQNRFDGAGGLDEAVFEEFGSLDLLQAIGDQAIAFLGQRQYDAVNIDYLEAHARAGQISRYDIHAVDFLFLLNGAWESQLP
jgi:hypothetical protein